MSDVCKSCSIMLCRNRVSSLWEYRVTIPNIICRSEMLLTRIGVWIAWYVLSLMTICAVGWLVYDESRAIKKHVPSCCSTSSDMQFALLHFFDFTCVLFQFQKVVKYSDSVTNSFSSLLRRSRSCSRTGSRRRGSSAGHYFVSSSDGEWHTQGWATSSQLREHHASVEAKIKLNDVGNRWRWWWPLLEFHTLVVGPLRHVIRRVRFTSCIRLHLILLHFPTTCLTCFLSVSKEFIFQFIHLSTTSRSRPEQLRTLSRRMTLLTSVICATLIDSASSTSSFADQVSAAYDVHDYSCSMCRKQLRRLFDSILTDSTTPSTLRPASNGSASSNVDLSMSGPRLVSTTNTPLQAPPSSAYISSSWRAFTIHDRQRRGTLRSSTGRLLDRQHNQMVQTDDARWSWQGRTARLVSHVVAWLNNERRREKEKIQRQR